MTSLVEYVAAKVKQPDVEHFVMCSLCNLASMIQGGGGASPVGVFDIGGAAAMKTYRNTLPFKIASLPSLQDSRFAWLGGMQDWNI